MAPTRDWTHMSVTISLTLPPGPRTAAPRLGPALCLAYESPHWGQNGLKCGGLGPAAKPRGPCGEHPGVTAPQLTRQHPWASPLSPHPVRPGEVRPQSLPGRLSCGLGPAVAFPAAPHLCVVPPPGGAGLGGLSRGPTRTCIASPGKSAPRRMWLKTPSCLGSMGPYPLRSYL